MATVLYFGAWSKDKLGHFLYAPGGGHSRRYEDALPFAYLILDSHLLDPKKPQDEGRYRRVVIGGWTVLTFWDRSADSRHSANSAFVAEGEHSDRVMIQAAREMFPEVMARLTFDLRPEGG